MFEHIEGGYISDPFPSMHNDIKSYTGLVFPVYFPVDPSLLPKNPLIFCNIGRAKESMRNGRLALVSNTLLFLRMIDLGFRNVVLIDSSISDRQIDCIVRPLYPGQESMKLIILVISSEAELETVKRILEKLSRKAFIHEVILEVSRIDELSKERIMQAIAE